MLVKDAFKIKPVVGAVGIEIEIEGVNLPTRIGNHQDWRVENDGSLRGESHEYVFQGPVDRDVAIRRLDLLDKSFKDLGSEIWDTGRAGVHIHVNVQDLTVKQLGCFISLYYIFENILLEYCGKDRVGNLFCLRTCDAEGIIPLLVGAFNSKRLRGFYSDDIRYAAMNLNSLPRYGSVEFRSMRSTGDMGVVKRWMDMLIRLKEYALQFNNPSEIVEGMSFMTPEVMFQEVFGEFNELAFNEESMYEGVRYAQDLAYGVDWDRPDPDKQAIIDGYMTAEGDV